MANPIKLSTLFGLVVSAFVAVSAISIGGIAIATLNQEASDRAMAMQDVALRAATTLIGQAIPDARADWSGDKVSKIVVPALPDLSDNAFVDAVSRVTGGTATVFAYDRAKNDFIRVSTSVKKQDGTRALGTTLGRNGPVFPVVMRGDTYRGEASILGVPYYTVYQPYFGSDGSVAGIVYAGVRKDVVTAAAESFVVELFGAVAALVAVLTAAALFLARRMARSIEPITDAIGKVAADQDVTLPEPGIGREIRDISRAVAILAERMRERRALTRASQADTDARVGRSEQVVKLIDEFRSQVRSALNDVGSVTRDMSETADRLEILVGSSAGQSTHASGAAEDTSERVRNVAAAAEQLAGSIREIASRASHTSDIVATASTRVAEADGAAAELVNAAQKIDDVVALIRAIAAQTNLLALNATIEAARAGEAGRGFAVVAAEVKTLSAQTARATDDIVVQVQQIQAAAAHAVDAIHAVAGIMSDANGAATAIAAAVEQQDAATREISHNIHEASVGVNTVTHNIEDVRREIGEASHAANRMASASERVGSESGRLEQTIERFLVEVAAA